MLSKALQPPDSQWQLSLAFSIMEVVNAKSNVGSSLCSLLHGFFLAGGSWPARRLAPQSSCHRLRPQRVEKPAFQRHPFARVPAIALTATDESVELYFYDLSMKQLAGFSSNINGSSILALFDKKNIMRPAISMGVGGPLLTLFDEKKRTGFKRL